jgi:hypothetical protein
MPHETTGRRGGGGRGQTLVWILIPTAFLLGYLLASRPPNDLSSKIASSIVLSGGQAEEGGGTTTTPPGESTLGGPFMFSHLSKLSGGDDPSLGKDVSSQQPSASCEETKAGEGSRVSFCPIAKHGLSGNGPFSLKNCFQESRITSARKGAEFCLNLTDILVPPAELQKMRGLLRQLQKQVCSRSDLVWHTNS